MLSILTLIGDSPLKYRSEYADDISVIRIGKNPRGAVAAIQEEVNKLIQLASIHKIKFDSSESELAVIGGA